MPFHLSDQIEQVQKVSSIPIDFLQEIMLETVSNSACETFLSTHNVYPNRNCFLHRYGETESINEHISRQTRRAGTVPVLLLLEVG